MEKNIPVTTLTIQTKARSLFNNLKSICSDNEGVWNLKFNPSSGRLENFNKRSQLHNVKVVAESASADTEAAK